MGWFSDNYLPDPGVHVAHYYRKVTGNYMYSHHMFNVIYSSTYLYRKRVRVSLAIAMASCGQVPAPYQFTWHGIR